MKFILTLSAVLILSGCVSKEYAANHHASNGRVQINDVPEHLVEDAGYDLKASIRSFTDGIDSNKLENRMFIIQTLRPNCLNPVLIDEEIVEARSPIGIRMNWHHMTIKCS